MGEVSGASVVDGLVGENTSTVTRSFWDTTTSGIDTSVAREGKETSELHRQSTFTGWSFNAVWRFDEGKIIWI